MTQDGKLSIVCGQHGHDCFLPDPVSTIPSHLTHGNNLVCYPAGVRRCLIVIQIKHGVDMGIGLDSHNKAMAIGDYIANNWKISENMFDY